MRAPSSQRLLLVLLVGSSIALCAQAYPTLFVARIAKSCTQHPQTAHMGGRGAGHLAPVKDDAVKFELQSSGNPITKLCPGASHTLKVVFPLPRYGLLTSTVGTFAEGDAWDCPNRAVLDKKQQEVHTVTLNIPCNPGSSAYLQVTSANGEGLAFRQASLTVPIDGSCAPAKCGVGSAGGGASGGARSSSLPAPAPPATSSASSRSGGMFGGLFGV